MTSKLFVLGATGLFAGSVAACHDDHQGASTPTPVPSASQSLDTAQVRALQSSETSAPVALNGGSVTLNDTSETSAPIAVNTM